MSTTEAQARTTALLREHGLGGWEVSFNNAKRTAGVCDDRHSTIKLSRYLLAQRSWEASMNTIAHEVAHAIVGAKHGHDAVWRRQHRALGGDGQRCFQHTDEQAPWVGTCPHGQSFHRYKRPPEGRVYRCRHAYRDNLVVWTQRAV